jgi:hypothetical protein
MMIDAPRRGTTIRIQDAHDLHDYLAAARPHQELTELSALLCSTQLVEARPGSAPRLGKGPTNETGRRR